MATGLGTSVTRDTRHSVDDIIVTGPDNVTHLANLDAVPNKTRGMRANRRKCEFFKDSIEYCVDTKSTAVDSTRLRRRSMPP